MAEVKTSVFERSQIHLLSCAECEPVTVSFRIRRYNDGMFVVKLTGRTGVVYWQNAPNAEGFRALATRD
jgi:hypothetical protein